MGQIVEFELEDLAATRRLARALAMSLAVDDVLLMDGPLGAGKTTVVRLLVDALGGDPAQVSSPTYTLLHRYDARMPVVHVDAYRLGSAGDLMGLGFDEQMEGGVGVIEWAERVAGAFTARGRSCWRLSLAHAGVPAAGADNPGTGHARHARLEVPEGKRLQDPTVTRMLP